MDNPEKLGTLGTPDEDQKKNNIKKQQKHSTICVGNTIRKQTQMT